MNNSVLVSLLSEASMVLPDENKMRVLWDEHSGQGYESIVASLRSHGMYSKVLPMVVQACRGLTRDEIAQTFIAYLDIHYSALIKDICESGSDGPTLIAGIMNSLLDEVAK